MKKLNYDRLNRDYAKAGGLARTEDVSNAQVRKALFALCEQFVLDNNIHAPETIYQMDHVIGNAYEFIEAICDIIGYASVKEEEAPEDAEI